MNRLLAATWDAPRVGVGQGMIFKLLHSSHGNMGRPAGRPY